MVNKPLSFQRKINRTLKRWPKIAFILSVLSAFYFGMRIMFFVLFFTIASGIITAGILSSVYNVATAQYPGFSMISAKGVIQAMASTIFLLFCGPVILVRNAFLGMITLGYPRFAFALSIMIALYWSYITGMIVVSTILMIII